MAGGERHDKVGLVEAWQESAGMDGHDEVGQNGV